MHNHVVQYMRRVYAHIYFCLTLTNTYGGDKNCQKSSNEFQMNKEIFQLYTLTNHTRKCGRVKGALENCHMAQTKHLI